MPDERWQKIEEIFEIAVELPADERESYLERECGGDAELRREVEQLISADKDAEEFIEEPLLGTNTLANFLKEDPEDTIESSVPPHFLGRRVGAYRLVRELGRGGMGAVFLARRDDAEFKKSVAIKLIKRGMDTDFILKRFRNERQILATLDHPYIGRLLDGGTTDDDLPYFVMEFIEGEPIHQYCDANRLSIRERLQLFQKVCSAVNYAHQNLIIHRDLKPGNILVVKDSTPKLLDFGIAKILNPELAVDTLAPTATGMRLMTPEYASPEQFRGEGLTPASDIYSLGVLLYELLTGKRPYRFSNRSPHEIARVICEDEPENPASAITDKSVPSVGKEENSAKTLDILSRNRRTTPETLHRELSGSLRNILFKALRKSPENRYNTAEDFARDIQAYLDGMPVAAPNVHLTDERFDDSMSANESLAVLPFRTFRWKTSAGGDPDTGDFLSIGLADALISRLSSLRNVSVRPTSSIVKYAAEAIEPETAGRELSVSHVLDGRIQHIGKRVRVTAQLIQIRNTETVWAGQFDEESDDILNLQDSISSQVAYALIDKLTGDEQVQIQKRGTDNAKAYEAYLKGRYYWHSYEVEGLAKALVCFYEAIALDPNFALAYTGVANYFNFLSVFGLMSPEESFPAAKEAARRAIELDNTSAEAYTSLATAVLGYDWDLEESEKLLKRAFELNPNYGEAHLWHAHLLGLQNKHEKSLKAMQRAERLNTVSPSLLVNYAIRLRDARKFDEALLKIRQAQTMKHNFNIATPAFAWVVDFVNIGEEAEREVRLAVESNPEFNLPRYALAYILASNGKPDEARSILEELEERKKRVYVPSSFLALTYAKLGENDLAFKWLDQSFAERDFWALWIPVDPRYDVLKDDPRFDLYVQRIRPIDEDAEIHQSRIPTKILPPGEKKAPKTFKESPKTFVENLPEEKTVSSRRRPFPAKTVFAGLFGVLLIGLLFSAYRYNYFPFSARQNSSPATVSNHSPTDNQAKTLVILPFTTDLDAENEESFGIGLADSIYKKLGEIKQITAHSVKTVIDDTKSPRAIAEEFGARYILRGRLHKTIDRIQVTAELLNAADDKILWLETFDEAITDFPNLQVEITERVLKILTVELSIAERERFNRIYTKNSEAYQLYLVGRYQTASRTQENLNKAIRTFSQARDKDPDFALAYVGLSDAYSLLNIYQIPPPPDAYAKAKENARKALALDNNLAEAHASLGYLLFYGERNFAEAERHFLQAVDLNPSYPTTYHWFSLILSATGRHDQAVENIKNAIRLEPRSAIIHTAASMTYYHARNFSNALEEANAALEIDNGFVPAYKMLRVIHGATGNYEGALEAYHKERQFSGNPAENDPHWLMISAQVEAYGNRREDALENLKNSLAAPTVKNNVKAYGFEFAAAYALLGETDKALEWLELSRKSDTPNLVLIQVDARFDKLREDTRFQEFVSDSFN